MLVLLQAASRHTFPDVPSCHDETADVEMDVDRIYTLQMYPLKGFPKMPMSNSKGHQDMQTNMP